MHRRSPCTAGYGSAVYGGRERVGSGVAAACRDREPREEVWPADGVLRGVVGWQVAVFHGGGCRPGLG